MSEASQTATAAEASPAAQPPEQWAYVEIMGHRSHYGRISEVHKYGAALLHVEVPTADPGVFETHEYNGSAIFAMHPCTEQQARSATARIRGYGRWEPPHTALIEFQEPGDPDTHSET